MKKYTIIVVLLAGCTNPYTCFRIKAGQTITGPADAFCISNEDFEYIKNKRYTNRDLVDLAAFATNELNNSCSIERNATFSDSLLIGGNYKYSDGTTFSNLDYGYVCKVGTVYSYENYLSEKEKIKLDEENADKQLISNFQKIEKKIGKKLCDYDEEGFGALFSGKTVPKNCAFKLNWFFSVLNQTSTGTLITIHSLYRNNFGNSIYFISKNPTDSNLVDDQRVQDGYFENIGTYKYTAVSGATKTVLKLKRLSIITNEDE